MNNFLLTLERIVDKLVNYLTSLAGVIPLVLVLIGVDLFILYKLHVHEGDETTIPRTFYVPVVASTPRGIVLTHIYLGMWHYPRDNAEAEGMLQQARDTFFGTNVGALEIAGAPYALNPMHIGLHDEKDKRD